MKQVKGNEVLEYLIDGCKARYDSEHQFQYLDTLLFYNARLLIEKQRQWEVDESTRKKENLSFKEALIAMEHGHCVATSMNVKYKIDVIGALYWDEENKKWLPQECRGLYFLHRDTYSIVPDPSIKKEEEPKQEIIITLNGKTYKITEVE